MLLPSVRGASFKLPPSTSIQSPNSNHFPSVHSCGNLEDTSRGKRRVAKWGLTPPLKRSFERPNPSPIAAATQYKSCCNISEQNRTHWRRRQGFSAAGGVENQGNMNRVGIGGRSPQSSFDSHSDVAQISLNWMRVNGGMAPLRSLMTSNTRAASSSHLTRMTSLKRQQHVPSLERRKDSKEGDHNSRKSLSLGMSNDVESGRKGTVEDADDTPLMNNEKTGNRLIVRELLYEKRRYISDKALFFVFLGIGMMIIENELRSGRVIAPGSLPSITLKTLVVMSTLFLITFVAYFHVLEVKLFMNANSIDDWRISLTLPRILRFSAEFSICALCPVDILSSQKWRTVDSILSLAMFGRLFWLGRVMLLHSRLFSDASSRSIAGLNRVNFNARFILKTLMTLAPGTMLMVFTASLWIIAGWILRLCERPVEGFPAGSESGCEEFPGDKRLLHASYLNSLWMIAITFLSVGYGDIVPHTYCGRMMAVITGILGTCTSSMIVAVIARKLELTRAEKHVHNFMLDSQLSKQLKHSAANVLRETWLIYKFRRLTEKVDVSRVRMHQRKFLAAITELRRVKREQRKLAENLVSLGDVAKTTSNTYELMQEVHCNHEGLALRVTSIEQQLAEISTELATLVHFLRMRHESSSPSPAASLRQRPSIGMHEK